MDNLKKELSMKWIYVAILWLGGTMVHANTAEISEGVPYVKVKDHQGKTYTIQRAQKEGYLTNTFALTSRPSPPFFIEPFSVDPEIETFGELEVLDFLVQQKGVFIDARLTNWFKKSAIPTAINYPFKLFLKDTPKRDEVLQALGGKKEGSGAWNFEKAKTILLYCNGAWCGQSPTAMRALIDIGYPKSKMKYYRGGMQAWQLLGLTTIVPKESK
jgi:rhodanese-related sulfurtransferase